MPQAAPKSPPRVSRRPRGHRTHERILATTERLLREKRLEDLSVQEIVREARSSVGSFYHLFGSKDALVAPLYARYDERIMRGAERVLHPDRWRGRSLSYRIGRLLRHAVRLYRRDRGLMRSLALHARSHPGALTAKQRRRRQELYDRLTDLVLEHRHEIARPDPESAVRLGFLFVGSALRDRILFEDAPHPRTVTLDDRTLATELARAFLAYLRHPDPEARHALD